MTRKRDEEKHIVHPDAVFGVYYDGGNLMAEFVQPEMKVIKPDGAILVSPESLETFWNELGDIPVDDDGIIQEPFLWWPKGTDRENIWHWFDEKYPGGVVKLMGLEESK